MGIPDQVLRSELLRGQQGTLHTSLAATSFWYLHRGEPTDKPTYPACQGPLSWSLTVAGPGSPQSTPPSASLCPLMILPLSCPNILIKEFAHCKLWLIWGSEAPGARVRGPPFSRLQTVPLR